MSLVSAVTAVAVESVLSTTLLPKVPARYAPRAVRPSPFPAPPEASLEWPIIHCEFGFWRESPKNTG